MQITVEVEAVEPTADVNDFQEDSQAQADVAGDDPFEGGVAPKRPFDEVAPDDYEFEITANNQLPPGSCPPPAAPGIKRAKSCPNWDQHLVLPPDAYEVEVAPPDSQETLETWTA